ncbi:hypothetical protein [Streptomyces otsuchiensis]|uniref:hypothetical protein n=1 Tax=Streptomyces otsuchiensis TaxID=2681388 RepID=UPI001030CFB8|nr:hypothetical protein [Streptomyces otsuchiensis]
MTDYTGSFPFREPEWIQLMVGDRDGAEAAAREIVERGGEEDGAYAQAVYPELETVCRKAVERGGAPVAVMVPEVRPSSPPFVVATAFMVLEEPPEEGRELEVLSLLMKKQRPYHFRPPEVATVELPLGPAVRVREVCVDGETPDGRELLVESVTYYVLSPKFPEGVLQFTVSWTSLGLGAGLAATAEEMAAGLVLRER